MRVSLSNCRRRGVTHVGGVAFNIRELLIKYKPRETMTDKSRGPRGTYRADKKNIP